MYQYGSSFPAQALLKERLKTCPLSELGLSIGWQGYSIVDV